MKTGYIIGGVAITGLLAYLGYLKFVQPKTQTPEIEAPKPSNTTVSTPATTVSTTTVPIKPVTQPIRETGGFGGPPPGGKPAPKLGDKAAAGATGANGYKSASATSGNIYKYYRPSSYIGTYLATDGVYTKLAVEETGFFSNSFVTVWVPTKDVVLY